jgi:hypothetical protein
MTVKFFITRDEEDFEVIAHVTFRPACKGKRDSICGVRNAGPPLEPDEPAGFEIESVTDKDGNEIDADKNLEERIYEESGEPQELNYEL